MPHPMRRLNPVIFPILLLLLALTTAFVVFRESGSMNVAATKTPNATNVPPTATQVEFTRTPQGVIVTTPTRTPTLTSAQATGAVGYPSSNPINRHEENGFALELTGDLHIEEVSNACITWCNVGTFEEKTVRGHLVVVYRRAPAPSPNSLPCFNQLQVQQMPGVFMADSSDGLTRPMDFTEVLPCEEIWFGR